MVENELVILLTVKLKLNLCQPAFIYSKQITLHIIYGFSHTFLIY